MLNLLQATEIIGADGAPEVPILQQIQPFIFIGLMVLAMWLLIWRPDAKRRKAQTQFREGLKKGDKVITAGGIYAVIKEVNETSILVEVDSNVTLRIDKNMVVADPAGLQQK